MRSVPEKDQTRHSPLSLSAKTQLSLFARSTIGLLICGAAMSAVYLWVDQPVSYFVYNELRPFRAVFDLAGRLPKLVGPLVITFTLILGVRSMLMKPAL